MELKYITIHTITPNTSDERNVTIAYGKYQAFLLGCLEHNTTLLIDQRLVDQLQELVNVQASKNQKESKEKRILNALEIAVRYGSIDGAHHKAWVIDQMMRILAGDNYNELIKENGGEWDCGIAP